MRRVILTVTLTLAGLLACAGCSRDPQARTSQRTSELSARVDDALAEIAWPSVPLLGPDVERPRIRMAPLPRPRTWPNLRRWRSGGDVPREPTFSPALSAREREILGQQVFMTYCARCHGREGRGDGPMARRLRPPPRNLARGPFRFRSTPTGAPPTDTDLFRTVSGGLHGTGMMAFADLPEEQRWAVVTYVRSLSPGRRPAGEPVPIPPRPGGRIDVGLNLVEQLGCATCHGKRFQGNGPSAAELRDVEGRPIAVPDLRHNPPKRGREPVSLYLTLATGLDGTPMPSYADAVSPDQLWAVVDYLLSIIPGDPLG